MPTGHGALAGPLPSVLSSIATGITLADVPPPPRTNAPFYSQVRRSPPRQALGCLLRSKVASICLCALLVGCLCFLATVAAHCAHFRSTLHLTHLAVRLPITALMLTRRAGPSQVGVLALRNFRSWIRNPTMLASELVQYIFIALFVGSMYIK